MFEEKSTHGQEKVRNLDETRGDQIYVYVFLMAESNSMTFLCLDWFL